MLTNRDDYLVPKNRLTVDSHYTQTINKTFQMIQSMIVHRQPVPLHKQHV